MKFATKRGQKYLQYLGYLNDTILYQAYRKNIVKEKQNETQ